MRWFSIIAIYGLFWVMSAILVLPFGVRTHEDVGAEKLPGQADGAPANFQPRLVAKRATILAAIIFALFYANYVQGWLTLDDLDFAKNAPSAQSPY
jgi:predicted secreted protein